MKNTPNHNSAATPSFGGGRGEALLSTTYFGPVQWYQKLNRYHDVAIERMDSFVKQTYRNRCVIAAPNGPQALTIPVCHDADKPLTRDIRISDHGDWRRLHWNALQTAYGESPFFEYYADDLHPFFERRWAFLYDFNMEITQLMCQLLDIHPHVSYTTAYTPSPSTTDYRTAIQPKQPAPDPDFTPRRYYQVYEAKHGFMPNLSIVDLLLNMGPEAIFYL